MKKYRIPLKDSDKLAFKFKNSHILLNDDQVSLKYNGQPFTTFTSKALKGNKLGQALFDIFKSYRNAVKIETAVELVKAYDDFKSRNALPREYDKDANFYMALNQKDNDSIADKQNGTIKIDYVQGLVNFLTSNLGMQSINLSQEKENANVNPDAEFEETGTWELVNVINGDIAYNAGAGMGCCIFGASPGTGERYGSPSSIKSSAVSAMVKTNNRSIKEFDGEREINILGSYVDKKESCYYVLRDPSRPNNSNDGSRYVLILLDEWHWTLWDDVDAQQIICNITKDDFDNYKLEHDGEEAKYMETIFPTPHFVDVQICTQFAKRLQLVNPQAKKLLETHHINADTVLEQIRKYKQNIKESKAKLNHFLNYSGGLSTRRENELASPETIRERQEEQERLQEINRLLKSTPINDEIRFNFKNNFITFRININESLYRRNELSSEFENYFPSLDSFDDEEEIDENTQITLERNTIELPNANDFGKFVDRLSSIKDNIEENECPFSFTLTYVVKPKVIANFLLVDSLNETDKKELNRSDEVIRLTSNDDGEKIKKLINLFKDENDRSPFDSLFKFLSDFYEENVNLLVKPFISPTDRRTYMQELMKKPTITNEDGKIIVDSITTDVNQHKFNIEKYTGEKKKSGDYKLLDNALQTIFKKYNDYFKDVLNFKFPTDIFYDNINFNNNIEESRRIQTLISPTSRAATRENAFATQVRNIFFNKYYKLLRNDSRGSGRKILTKTLSDSDLDSFVKDINALRISMILDEGLDKLQRNLVKLTDEEKNTIINGGNISVEEAEEINNNNALQIEEQSSNIVVTKEDNDLVDEFKEKNFFTNSNNLPKIDNLDNVDFNDIEWADGYSLHIGIVNRISNGNTVKSFLTNYKQAIDDNDINTYLSAYNLSDYLIKQLNKRFLDNGKYAYLFNLLTPSTTPSSSTPSNEGEEVPEEQEEEIEEPMEVEEIEVDENEEQPQEEVEEIEVEEDIDEDIDEDINEDIEEPEVLPEEEEEELEYELNKSNTTFRDELTDIIEDALDTFEVDYTTDDVDAIINYKIVNGGGFTYITLDEFKQIFGDRIEEDDAYIKDIVDLINEESEDLYTEYQSHHAFRDI